MMMNDDEGWRRMIDFKVFWGFAFIRKDGRTDGQTFVIVESLSRLKTFKKNLAQISQLRAKSEKELKLTKNFEWTEH